jgi:hypothetical protein
MLIQGAIYQILDPDDTCPNISSLHQRKRNSVYIQTRLTTSAYEPEKINGNPSTSLRLTPGIFYLLVDVFIEVHIVLTLRAFESPEASI